jgi:hypothetical protein
VISSRALAAVYVVLSLCAVVWLWHFWTPRCTETCARWVVLSMYATFLVVPVTALVIAALTLSGRLSRNASLLVFAGCAVCGLLWSGFVTHGAVQVKGLAGACAAPGADAAARLVHAGTAPARMTFVALPSARPALPSRLQRAA